MRHGLVCLGVALLASVSIPIAQQQEKPKDAAPAAAADAAKPAAPSASSDRKNPVKPTPEGIASAKKLFGYDCAMCHGANGDGKGDAAASMNLTMKDWRTSGVLSGISDGDMFDIIVKGKDKMIGEGDRLKPEQTWNMINYVRTFTKKESVDK